jgi:hypothetical protein
VLTSATWNSYLAANLNKLLGQGHRVLTVAQFAALTGLEDGDEAYVEVDVNGVQWHLRYLAVSGKWRYIGGPPLYAEVVADEATGGTVYQALASAGPALALLRGGDYDVEVGAMVWAVAAIGYMSYDIGGTAANDADAFESNPGGGLVFVSGSRRRRKTGIAAATTLTAKYHSTVTGLHFALRWMAVTPVQIT